MRYTFQLQICQTVLDQSTHYETVINAIAKDLPEAWLRIAAEAVFLTRQEKQVISIKLLDYQP